jgi:6-phosphogluconolactonase (cycloisomerase 2 family)
MVFKILVGGYTDAVSILSFDPNSSPPSLKLDSVTKTGNSPSWVSKHPSRNDLALAAIEGPDGKLTLLKLQENGAAEVIQTILTKGGSPCHIEWTENEVIVSNVSFRPVYFEDKESITNFWPSISVRASFLSHSPHQVH